MKSTRIKILEYLQQKQTATTAELSHVVGFTAANIRHHPWHTKWFAQFLVPR